MQLQLETLTSLGDSRYPQFLTDPSVSALVTQEVFKRTQGVLMVADIGCGGNPVSRRLLGNFPSTTKIMGVDSGYGTTLMPETQQEVDNINFYPKDIRSIKDLRGAKKDFFTRHKHIGKQNFDVVVLSNVLNYIIDNDEQLDPGKISERLYEFIEKFLVKSIAKKGIVIIQNGDKYQRDTRFGERNINEYFSRELEELLHKYLEDFFYLGVAGVVPHTGWIDTIKNKILRIPQVQPIQNFNSLEELDEIREKPGFLTAVNVRCMQLIK